MLVPPDYLYCITICNHDYDDHDYDYDHDHDHDDHDVWVASHAPCLYLLILIFIFIIVIMIMMMLMIIVCELLATPHACTSWYSLLFYNLLSWLWWSWLLIMMMLNDDHHHVWFASRAPACMSWFPLSSILLSTNVMTLGIMIRRAMIIERMRSMMTNV